MLTDNQRPGVYSVYDVTSDWLSPRSAGYAAVAARANGGEAGRVYRIASLGELAEAFAPDTEETGLYGAVGTLLRAGVSRVLAVKAEEEEDYTGAFALLEGEENVAAVVTDSEDEDVLLDFRDSILAASGNRRERVGFAAAGEAEAALDLARELNSERVVLCCPAVSCADSRFEKAVYGAAALAGAVLARNDPVWSFSGERLGALRNPARLTEARVQELLRGGVTVLEELGGETECVRAVTTRTRRGKEADYSLRGLSSILCIDDVMRHVRARLQGVIRGGRGGSTESVRSQAMVVLADRMDAGILEQYDPPKCRADESDPGVCVVELSFRVAHVVSQIHVTASIQV